MATNPPQEGYPTDDFLDQILHLPSYSGLPVNDVGSSSDTASLNSSATQLSSVAGGLHHHPQLFPLGLSLDNGRDDVSDSGGFGVKSDRGESVNMGSLYPAFEQLQPHSIRQAPPQVQQIEEDFLDQEPGLPTRYSYENLKAATEDFSQKLGGEGFGSVYEGALSDCTKITIKCLNGLAATPKQIRELMQVDGLTNDEVKSHLQAFQGQPTPSIAVTVPHPPSIRPRVRARRGQATDPHSIAERLRRERISERIKALQELVPSCNKTDRAAMLDEILDYVKFLRLQVKVLSMSRLGGAGAVAQLVADIPLQSVEGDKGENLSNQQVWEKWSNEETEQEVAKLMEEDVGAAMQFLQSKSLCIMPISLAALIYPTLQSDDHTNV